MDAIIIKKQKETSITSEAIYQLKQEAYKQWIEAGYEAPWLHHTLEDDEKKRRGSVVFVALDAETGELLGTHSLTLNRRKNMALGYGLAVSPSAQRHGVASCLLKDEVRRLKDAGYMYMIGYTAESAVWSVSWHLRNQYSIIGYKRSPDDNFANYVFRKQLISVTFSSLDGIGFILRHPVYALHSNATFCLLRFALSCAVTRITKDSQGRDNLLGSFARRIIRKRHA